MTPLRDPASKILTREEFLEGYRRPRTGRLVFTNGVFDLLHPGHVRYLVEARGLGDGLVVALNSDASARRLAKGPDRPIVPQEDRLVMVAALECVDAVTLFEEDTPADLLQALLPDLLVKGGDYAVEEVAGGAAVQAAGGEVRILPFLPGYSTSDLVRRIRATG